MSDCQGCVVEHYDGGVSQWIADASCPEHGDPIVLGQIRFQESILKALPGEECLNLMQIRERLVVAFGLDATLERIQEELTVMKLAGLLENVRVGFGASGWRRI